MALSSRVVAVPLVLAQPILLEAAWKSMDLTTEVKLAGHIARFRTVTDPLGLTVSIGELSAAAEYPAVDNKDSASYLLDTDEQAQAGKLVRGLLTARAAGVDRVAWFCHFLGVLTEKEPHEPNRGWDDELATTGVRNDVFTTTDTYPPKATWVAQHAWRKPNGYAYQRLAWLLSLAHAGEPSLVVSENGATVIRVRFRHAPSVGPDGAKLSGSFRYAWVMWLDAYAGCRCKYPEGDGVLRTSFDVFLDSGPNTDVALLSLVPEVEGTGGGGAATDAAGFCLPDSVDWNWADAFSALDSWAPWGASVYVRVLAATYRASAHRPAPVCLLTNLEAAWVVP